MILKLVMKCRATVESKAGESIVGTILEKMGEEIVRTAPVARQSIPDVVLE